MNLKDIKVLVYDGGLFVSLAERLVELDAFGKVGFFKEWQDGFCDGRELIVGTGLEGITRVKYFWDEVNDYDLIVFPDVWQGDLQEYLRKQGRRIWGAGRNASLELARWQTKEKLKELGLPDNEAAQIEGLENLRVYLQEHKDVFVKISAFRGLGETFESESYDQSKGQLDELRSKYGAMMDMVMFIVEKKIPDAKEIGYDGFCVDGEFPNQSFFGVEVKDKAYFGMLMDYEKLPQSVRDTNTKLSYSMDGYRQFWSTELREKDGKGYLIDATARHASPAGETFCHAFTNLPEILFEGAGGKLVHPKSSAKYAAQIILCSEWAESHMQPVEFPEEIRPFVKLFNHCRIDGADYVVPQIAKMKQIGSVIGLGNTPDEACNAAKERAKQVKGYDLEAETDALDKAVSEMKGFE
jgi:hypothetical protein